MEFFSTEDLRSDEIVLRLDHTCDAQPEKRWLPAYYFDICLPDGTKAGHCDLRIGHNDKTYIGGNIGYGIDAPYRGHHYAAKACGLLFRLARKHGMAYLIITCDPANAASAKTCERAGGRYLETADIPEDNEMYAEGKRQVRVYRFDLTGTDRPTGIRPAVTEQIRALAKRYSLRRVVLFGSRARGDFRPGSDIDLAVSGGDIDRFRLAVDEETDTLLRFDVADLDRGIPSALREAIDKEGRVLYEEV